LKILKLNINSVNYKDVNDGQYYHIDKLTKPSEAAGVTLHFPRLSKKNGVPINEKVEFLNSRNEGIGNNFFRCHSIRKVIKNEATQNNKRHKIIAIQTDSQILNT
jgi:hypothetical protein